MAGINKKSSFAGSKRTLVGMRLRGSNFLSFGKSSGLIGDLLKVEGFVRSYESE